MPTFRFLWTKMEPHKYKIPEYKVKVSDPIKHETESGPYVTYCITMQTSSAAFRLRKSSTRRRYSDFDWVRKELDKIDNWNSPPPLPPKRLWGGMEPRNVEARRQGLEDWLKQILNDPQYLSYTGLHLFLQTELSLEQIQDYMKGDFPEQEMENIWKNNGKLYPFQAHNVLHNCFPEDPIEIHYTPEDHRPPLSRSLYSDRSADWPLTLDDHLTQGAGTAEEQEVTHTESTLPSDAWSSGLSSSPGTTDQELLHDSVMSGNSSSSERNSPNDGDQEGQAQRSVVIDGSNVTAGTPDSVGDASTPVPATDADVTAATLTLASEVEAATSTSVGEVISADLCRKLVVSEEGPVTSLTVTDAEIAVQDAASSSGSKSSMESSKSSTRKTIERTTSEAVGDVPRDDYSINGD